MRKAWMAVCVGLVFSGIAVGQAAIDEAIAQATALVEQARAAKARDDGAAVSKLLGEALQVLAGADPEHRSDAAWTVRYAVGAAAHDIDPEVGQRAWDGVLRYFAEAGKDAIPANLEWLQRARHWRAVLHERKYESTQAIALRVVICNAWEAADKPLEAALSRCYLGQARVQGRATEDGLLGLQELERSLALLDQARQQDPAVTPMWSEAARLYTVAMVDMEQVLDPRVAQVHRELHDYYRAHPPDPQSMVDFLWERGSVLRQTGYVVDALRLAQESLDLAVKEYQADDPRTFWPRAFLADVLKGMGDYDRCLHYQEEGRPVLDRLGPKDARRARWWSGYGHTLMVQGNVDKAIEAFLASIEATDRGQVDSQGIATLAITMNHLGQCCADAGRKKEALAWIEQALVVAKDQPITSALVRGGKGMALQRAADFKSADKCLVDSVPTVVQSHGPFQKLNHLRRHAQVLAELKDKQRLQGVLERLVKHAADTALECQTLPGRASYQLAGNADAAAVTVLSLCKWAERPRDLEVQAYEVLETLRGVEVRTTALAGRLAANEPFQQQWRQAMAVRARIAGLVSRGEGRSDELLKLASEREEIEFRALYDALQGVAGVPVRLTVKAVADALPDGAVAVAWRVVTIEQPDPRRRGFTTSEERFEAHVVTRAGRLERIDLGPVQPIRDAATAWRKAIVAGEVRGDPVDKPKADDPAAKLSALVFGKIKGRLGGAKVLIACLDDELHKVPIELMPDAEKEGYEFRFTVSLMNLLPRPAADERAPSLFAVGGLDFDQRPEETATPPADAAGTAGERGMVESKVTDERYRELEFSGKEVRHLARDYEDFVAGGPAVVKSGRDASREVVLTEAPQARYLHFATHGYFLKPAVDRERYEQVSRVAPMALCGLVLSGANRTSKDFLGVITGEEVAALNLSGCKMAVLSACMSYVGTSRAGHGLASLQSAFHAAGVESVIASRWSVPDDSTERLMSNFYSRLWKDGLSPREALRLARDQLRKDGLPVRAWAAFILTGDLR